MSVFVFTEEKKAAKKSEKKKAEKERQEKLLEKKAAESKDDTYTLETEEMKPVLEAIREDIKKTSRNEGDHFDVRA